MEEIYNKLNDYLNEICKYLEVQDSFLLENIHILAGLNDKMLKVLNNYNFDNLNINDKWILTKMNKCIKKVRHHMEKYEGADNLVAEMSFGAELVDVNNPEAGMKYLLNGKEISYDEYTAFGSKIFAAEESTN